MPFVGRVGVDTEKLRKDSFSGGDDRRCFELDSTPQCLLPTASAVHEGKLLVVCAGIDRVMSWNPQAKYNTWGDCEKALKDRKTWSVGEHPTGIAVDAGAGVAYTWSTSARALTEVHLASDATVNIPVPAAKAVIAEEVRRGRTLFFTTGDPRISRNGRGCASCHPDGREDALVWPTPKGKRQTPMLAGRLEGTAPFDWNGAHASLPVHIRSTIKNLEGKGLADAELEALGAYVMSLAGPRVKRGTTDARVAEGRRVFESSEAACSSCHVEEKGFTDGQGHSLDGRWAAAFDTPSLRFVGGTAPYFHDGRFATLDDLVEKCDGKMGKTKHLGIEDRAALVTYLRSL